MQYNDPRENPRWTRGCQLWKSLFVYTLCMTMKEKKVLVHVHIFHEALWSTLRKNSASMSNGFALYVTVSLVERHTSTEKRILGRYTFERTIHVGYHESTSCTSLFDMVIPVDEEQVCTDAYRGQANLIMNQGQQADDYTFIAEIIFNSCTFFSINSKSSSQVVFFPYLILHRSRSFRSLWSRIMVYLAISQNLTLHAFLVSDDIQGTGAYVNNVMQIA